MSFESEILLGRFRARGSKLILPTLALGAAAFLLSFVYGHINQQWQLITLYVACGLIAVFGFVIPTLRYLTTWTDITSARVVARSGLWGQHYRSVSMSEVEKVELSSGVISLYIPGQEALELRGLPKTKLVSQEISNMVARLNPSHSSSRSFNV